MVIHLFGDRLKELRKEHNLTQEEISEICQVAKQTISNWENNVTQPPFDIVKRLAQYFSVTIDYLLNFNQKDVDNMEKLKTALKEAGMWDYSIDDMSREDFKKAMQIVAMLKNKNNDKAQFYKKKDYDSLAKFIDDVVVLKRH